MLISATVTPPFEAGELPPAQDEGAMRLLAQALAEAGFEVVMMTEFGVIVRADQTLFEQAFDVRPPAQRQFSRAVTSRIPFLRERVGRVEVTGTPVPLM